MDGLIESHVVVRSSESGVWHGVLLAYEPETRSVRLGDARKAHSWTGAAATSGLALHGPGGGRITEPVRLAVVTGCSEILLATSTATSAWEGVPAWRV